MSKNRSGSGSCSWLCCCRAFLIIFTILGLLLAAAGVFLVLRYRPIFMGMLSKQMPLSPTSATFGSFKDPPADIYMSFRFFNITNPDSVVNGSKPIVKEIGPYVFKNKRVKTNISFNDEQTQISYDESRFYEFDTEKSVGTVNDTFIQLDLVGYGVLKQAYEAGTHQLIGRTYTSAKRDTPFKEHRVIEFLFGAQDVILSKVLPQKFPDAATRPPAVFGLFIDKKTGASKNGSQDSSYVLNTGKDDLSKYTTLVKYNNMSRLADVWPTENITGTNGKPYDANLVYGTLGTGFSPDVRKESVLNVFAADLCLTIAFIYKAPSKTGIIDTMRFTVDVPNWRKFVGDLNRAMCAPQDRNNHTMCMQDGILNATTCKGAALMMSLPHFLHADPFYQNLTDGLSPDEEKHSILLDIDPLTGAALNAAKRMQMNVRLMPIPFLKYRNLPKFTLLPLMWVEESGGVTPAGLAGLKERVHGKYNMLKTLAYVLVITGVAILPVTIVIFLIFKQRHNKKQAEEDMQMSQTKSGYNNTTPTGYVSTKRQSPNDGYSDEKRPLHI